MRACVLFELGFAGVLFELWGCAGVLFELCVMRVAICCVYLILFARPVECEMVAIAGI